MIEKSKLKDYANKLMFDMKDEEYETLANEFETILKQLDLIGEIENINSVEPMTFPYIKEDVVLRDDSKSKIVDVDVAFSNCHGKKGDEVKVLTKGKDESANRFMSWLIPYNNEFEDEQELIKIISEINLKVNRQVNSIIGVAPIMLFNKEKEYLQPLPNFKIMDQYLIDTVRVKISNESLFYYKGK